eukprot:11589196-Karenia_brevis.AAC.1
MAMMMFVMMMMMMMMLMMSVAVDGSFELGPVWLLVSLHISQVCAAALTQREKVWRLHCPVEQSS